MKKHFITIMLIVTILLGGVVLLPHQAEAGWIDVASCVFGNGDCNINTVLASSDLFVSIFRELGNLALRLSAQILALSGTILNMAIVMTLNIKAIYEATPAIEQVWVVIRNISSIFIIFALVYISIRKILDVDSPSLGTMIKNIVIAGLLINFSLFFTRVAIDASNLVSMQFYRAIAPNSQNVNLTDKGSISAVLANSFNDGGISDVFMQSLKIPKIYSNTNNLFVAGQAGTDFKILVATALGSALMIMAALSFFAAAVAFIVRLAILLLLMGFSPVYFVGMIFPDIQKNISGKWMGWLEQQLIFMPVYLLFMYVALRFISGSGGEGGFFAALDAAQLNAGKASESGWLLSIVGLLFQFSIAFILINIPLIAALQTGGVSAKWGAAAKDWVGGKLGGIAGRNTLGLAGKYVGKSFDSMAANAQGSAAGRGASTVLRSLGISQAVRGGIGKVEKGKYGSDQNLSDIDKENKDRAKVISGVQRSKAQNQAIKAYMDSHALGTTPTDAFKNQMKSITAKELEDVDIDVLKDPKFASAIPTAKFEALVKSDSLTPQQQQDLRQAREEGYKQILASPGGADFLLNTHLAGKSQDIAKLPGGIITDPKVAILLDPASLRKMVDENVSRADRDKIRTAFNTHLAAPGTTVTPAFQKAYDYMNGPAGQIF